MLNYCSLEQHNLLLSTNDTRLFWCSLSGHCPHDEVPEKVNDILIEWVKTAEAESTKTSEVDSSLQAVNRT